MKGNSTSSLTTISISRTVLHEVNQVRQTIQSRTQLIFHILLQISRQHISTRYQGHNQVVT
jgi:hypothetical protein